MKECLIRIEWDDNIWCAESEDELGIVLESGSFDALVERVRIAVPEMLEINLGYKGQYKIIFEASRVETMKAVG